jgi:hypothetical protein
LNDNELDPSGDAGDQSDTELNAMLAAADERLLAAILRDIDLDAGLAQIIGDPPQRETSPPAAAASSPPARSTPDLGAGPYTDGLPAPPPSSIHSRIALLRFEILDLADSADDTSVCATTAALLRGSASSLKELNRGLEARELARRDAISLMSDVDLALEEALDTQEKAIEAHKRAVTASLTYQDWRPPHRLRVITYLITLIPAVIAFPVFIALIWITTGHSFSGLLQAGMVIASIASAATVTALMVTRWDYIPSVVTYRTAAARASGMAAPGAHRTAARGAHRTATRGTRRAAAGRARITADVSGRDCATTIEAGRQADQKTTLSITLSTAPPTSLCDQAGKINEFRKELDQIQAGVIRLFGEVDDHSPRCAPHA